MPTSPLATAKFYLQLTSQLFFTALFALLTWMCWGLYREEKIMTRFEETGEPLAVTVTNYNSVKQCWIDHIQNVQYISFPYQDKNYTVRCLVDSTSITEGTIVLVLYSQADDAFRQLKKNLDTYKEPVSKLIGWSNAGLFSMKNMAFMAFLLFALVFFFLLMRLLNRIPGLTVFTSASILVVQILLCIGVLYTTYDAWSYYRQYHHIKNNGQPKQVTVAHKDKYYQTHKSGYRIIDFFSITYTARVKFREEFRIIPISESAYNTAKEGSQLHVLYDAEKNDMMSPDYKINKFIFIFTGLLWLLMIFFIRRRIRQWNE